MTFTDCWIWNGAKTEGYGIVRRGIKSFRAYKLIWEAFYGPVEQGKELDHLCRNKLCVNVDHLEPVSHKVNVLRGMSPGAVNSRKTHCPKGHPYDSKDSLRRYCSPCRKLFNRNYYRTKRMEHAIHG